MKKYAIDGRDEVRKFYADDDLISQYEKTRFSHPVWRLSHQREVAVANEILSRSRPTRVLDLALGTGRVSKLLKGFDAGFGIDINQKMLLKSRETIHRNDKTNQKWSLVMADAFQLPFKDGSFNAIVAFRFVRHFRYEDRKVILQEVRRVLASGGYFIFEALNENMGDFAIRIAGIDQYRIYDELWGKDSLTREMDEMGLQIESLLPILNRFRLLWMVSRGLLKLNLNLFTSFILEIINQFPSYRSYEWGVVCQKR